MQIVFVKPVVSAPLQDMLDTSSNVALVSNNLAIAEESVMSSNNYHPSFTPARANDGNLATYWSNFTRYHSEDYLEIDFGYKTRVFTVDIVNYIDGNSGLSEFDLQYYDDSTWKTIGRYKTNVVRGEIIHIEVPNIKTSKLRVTNFSLAPGRNCVTIYEFQVNKARASAKNTYHPAYSADKAFDGNKANYWTNYTKHQSSDYLEIDLGTWSRIYNVQITNFVNAHAGLTAFDLQYQKGNVWKTIGRYNTKHKNKENISIDVSGISARKLRITNFELANKKICVGINEFSVNTPQLTTEFSHASYPISNINDLKSYTLWTNLGSKKSEKTSVEIDLGRPGKVNSVNVDLLVNGYAGTRDFELQYFDGCHWFPAGDYTTNGKNHEIAILEVDNIIAQKWRLTYFNLAPNKTALGIYDMKVNGRVSTMPSSCNRPAEIDTDNDGLVDRVDTDDDNDGYPDDIDLFPLTATEWADFDGDGIGNNSDLDDDNDGHLDTDDDYPFDDRLFVFDENNESNLTVIDFLSNEANAALAERNSALSTHNAARSSHATMSASNSHPSFPPIRSNDGNIGSLWSNYARRQNGDYLQVDFGYEQVISSVNIVNSINAFGGMSAFELQYFDGTGWNSIGRYTTKVVTGEVIHIDVPNIRTSKLRVTNFERVAGKISVAITEFQVNTPTATASSTYHPAYSASNVIDGNVANVWTNYTKYQSDDTLEVDLGKITRIESVNIVNYVNGIHGMSAFDLESYTGGTWEKVGRYSTNNTHGQHIRIDVSNVVTRKIRITNFALASRKSSVAISEFQVNAPVASASSTYHPAYSANNINDGKMTNWWTNYTKYQADDYLEIDLGKTTKVYSVNIVNYVDGNAGMTAFELQYFDGGMWQTIDRYTTNHENKENIQIDIPGVVTRKLRITAFEIAQRKKCVAINEFEVNKPLVTTPFSHASYPLSNIKDTSVATFWSNLTHDFPSDDYVEVTLNSASEIVGATIEPIVNATIGVTHFDLQYFDGNDWVVQGTYETDNRNHEKFTIDIDAIVSQKWRLGNFQYAHLKNAAGFYQFSLLGRPTDEEINSHDGEYWGVLKKATVDECFYGVGDERNQYPIASPCGGQYKKNEAYIWGMTQFGDNIFFGTGANVMCLAVDSFIQIKTPYRRDGDLVCEFSHNVDGYGDWRPPALHIYNKTTHETRKLITPKPNDPAWDLLKFTTGIRSAGTHPSGIVFLAGPNLADGINMFAFNGRTGQLIGGKIMDDGYSNIRKMTVGSDGNLYVGFGNSEASIEKGGAIGRWAGNLAQIFSGDTSTLFDFEIVGKGFDGGATELTEHDGRLFISTWPDRKKAWPNPERNTGGIWMSPPLPLSADDIEPGKWQKMWAAGDYEPDPLVAGLIGGGASASFDGWFYWGTMHVPATSYQKWLAIYGEPTGRYADVKRRVVMENVWREISLFRGRNFGTGQEEIELLYGGSSVFDNRTNERLNNQIIKQGGGIPKPGEYRVYAGDGYNWTNKMNLMDQKPKYGRGGFGNEWNNYTWTMTVFNNDLYVGTMDHGQLAMEDDQVADYDYTRRASYGGDLFKFESANMDANPVNRYGLGNEVNYGFRTIMNDGKNMYLGSANNANLDSVRGGWELIKMSADYLQEIVEDEDTGTEIPDETGEIDQPTTVTETFVGPNSDITVFRPAKLGKGGVQHPVVIWGNGTSASPNNYSNLLMSLASEGFIVVAPNSGQVGDGEEMQLALDWILDQGDDSNSIYFDNISTKVGVFGHSQGGAATLLLASTDSRITSVVAIEPEPCEFFPCMLSSPKFPSMIIAGGNDSLFPADMLKTDVYDVLNTPSKIFAVHDNANHISWIQNRTFDDPIIAYFKGTLISQLYLAYFQADHSEEGWNFEF